MHAIRIERSRSSRGSLLFVPAARNGAPGALGAQGVELYWAMGTLGPTIVQNHNLVGGLEHVLFFHILGTIIPTD